MDVEATSPVLHTGGAPNWGIECCALPVHSVWFYRACVAVEKDSTTMLWWFAVLWLGLLVSLSALAIDCLFRAARITASAVADCGVSVHATACGNPW